MEINKIFELLAFIESFYPNNRTNKQKEVVANFWYEVFEDYDDNIVEFAVKHYIRTDTSGFEPKISHIVNIIKDFCSISSTVHISFDEAWDCFIESLYKISDNYQEAFDQLPPIMKKIIKAPYTLKEYSRISSELIHTKIKDQIKQSYNEHLKKNKKKLEFSYAFNSKNLSGTKYVGFIHE